MKTVNGSIKDLFKRHIPLGQMQELHSLSTDLAQLPSQDQLVKVFVQKVLGDAPAGFWPLSFALTLRLLSLIPT